MGKEIWKDVKGYDGCYQVSNLGNVYSKRSNKILSKKIDKDGYERLNISYKGNRKTIFVHRFVAETFIPNPQDKPQVNHKNSIRTDNRVENLEWVTCKENIHHSVRNGRFNKGVTNAKTYFSEKDIIEIRKLKKFFSDKELATIFNSNRSTIYGIVKRNTWKHI